MEKTSIDIRLLRQAKLNLHTVQLGFRAILLANSLIRERQRRGMFIA